MNSFEQHVARSKAHILFGKAIDVLEQLDGDCFPTVTSDDVRGHLLNILRTLRDPDLIGGADPVLLYQQAVQFQEYVSILAASSIEHISWPLVGYCDQIWEEHFGTDSPRVFYSTTQQNNYFLVKFSEKLKNQLITVLPKSQIQTLFDGKAFYCLQLASVEDENLPLYAIIGHEFGHALFHKNADEYEEVALQAYESQLAVSFQMSIQKHSGTPLLEDENTRIDKLLSRIYVKLATELFSDMVAALLMGPAYLLALHETGWGTRKNLFRVALSPNGNWLEAHPSHQFRQSCLHKTLDLDVFCSDLLKKKKNPELEKALGFLKESTTESEDDRVGVDSPENPDTAIIRHCLQENIVKVKESLQGTVIEFRKLHEKRHGGSNQSFSSDNIHALLERFSHHILPNIIPDGSPLGTPAEFADILNAAALERFEALEGCDLQKDDSQKRIGVVERLTAKALEVSFVQKEYLKWKKEDTAHGRTQ